ncbi:glycosyltransferase family 4 protein [Lichenicola sp.]|uniref:glycosyltransferase family 4 protein n=1 Tax=Lichenicola sp. TaxID=2804529 RepID=UPI003B005725
MHGRADLPPPPLLFSVFATFAVGGPQMRFATLANRLGRRWRHVILAMDGNLACREHLSAGLDVSFLEAGRRTRNPIRLYRRQRRMLRELQPDLLLTHNWGSIEWALANRWPGRLVAQLHAEDGFGPEERTRRLRRRNWFRRVVLGGTPVVVPSLTLSDIARRNWRLPSSALHQVPNGIDLASFQPGPPVPPLPEWRLAHDGVVIGTVAALRPEKNLARLIQAVAMLDPPARLLVGGDGPDRAQLEGFAAGLLPRDRVVFVGHVAEPAPLYRHMDIFALSSDTEQMPLSLLEAMASGLPAASCNVGDVADMLGPESSELVTALDAAALGKALARLAGDATLRRRLGEANRARAEQLFDEARMIERWSGLLDRTRQAFAANAR